MGLHHPTAQGVFHRHVLGEGGQRRPRADLAQRHLQRLRRLGLQRLKLLQRPLRTVSLQRGEDLLDRVEGEQPVDGLAVGVQRRRAWLARHAVGHGLGIRRIGEKFVLQGRRRAALDEMGVDAQGHCIRRLQPRPRQRQPNPRLPRQPRQEPAAPHVGEQADARLGHGVGGALRGDANIRRLADPHAAAHDDAVDDGRDRLGIIEHQMVQLILGLEEGLGLRRIPRPALGDHADVAPGAEAALARMVDQHRAHGLIAAPGQQRLDHRLAHGPVQRMDRLGPVQGDAADVVFDAGDDFSFAHLTVHRVSSRAMMTRIISLVPSRMRCTRRSRTIRSSG
ncbi:hypothetical protein D3C72_1250560 [compost metagenome]